MIAPMRIALLRLLPILAAPFALAACMSAGPITDPEVAALAARLNSDAASYYAALAISRAPQCSYEQNKNSYDTLSASAGALQSRLAAVPTNPALTRAGSALTRLIDEARLSHHSASAKTDDTHGVCMAPGAIALNAQAIARASLAIAATQTTGDR